MAMFFVNVSVSKSITLSESVSGSLFVDDLEDFEEIVLEQNTDNKIKVAPLTYKPYADDLEILELCLDFVIYNSSNEVVRFNLPVIDVNNNTIYTFAYYKNFLNSYTPPPPRIV
jgi:hypothetical protein